MADHTESDPDRSQKHRGLTRFVENWAMPSKDFGTTDAVCEAYADSVKITIQVRRFNTEDNRELPFVFIEAESAGFEFLGNLLMAFAHSDEGCRRHLAPNGPGSTFFGDDTQVGIVLHRRPCDHPSTPITDTAKQIL